MQQRLLELSNGPVKNPINSVKAFMQRGHKFLYLERAAIAQRQDSSEKQKFVARPTRLNRNLFFANGITFQIKEKHLFAGEKRPHRH